jgi:hypothetical protein
VVNANPLWPLDKRERDVRKRRGKERFSKVSVFVSVFSANLKDAQRKSGCFCSAGMDAVKAV